MMMETAGRARIVVVDDDAVTSELVCDTLRREGYLVSACDCAAAGLSAATELDPDLILLDVMLPDGDGFSVCRWLRANPDTRRIPVIFLTAKGDRDAVVRGFESGGVDYIVKPFDAEVLLARVQTQTTLSRLSRKLQQTLNERTQRLRQANQRLQELSLELARIEERQRRTLAEELHDTTIQQLVLARLLIESGQGTGGEGGGHRAQLIRLIDDSLTQLRTLVFELSPPMLHQIGLYAAIEWLAQQLGEQWGLEISCECVGEPARLQEVSALTLFQGARELLVNVAKHAEAKRAQITLICSGDRLRIIVADDGQGFDKTGSDAFCAPGQVDASSGGFGLYHLRSRIELLGGSIEIDNRPRGGGLVCVDLPLKRVKECSETDRDWLPRLG